MKPSAVRASILLLAALVLLPVAIGGVTVPGEASADGPHALQSANKTTDVIDISTERTSIYLSSERIVVDEGENARLRFSAVNYVTNERPMTVQLIFQAPSGVSVAGVADVDEGDSQYVATRTLDPGGEFGTEIAIDPGEPGTYPVTAKAVYYFGTNHSNGSGKEVELDVTQRSPPKSSSEKVASSVTSAPSAVISDFTEAFPPEYAPLFVSGPLRINVLYALVDYFLIIAMCSLLLLSIDSDETGGAVALSAMVSAVITPILFVVGYTRVVLLAGVGFIVLGFGLLVVLTVILLLFGS
ncbi:hypothetical protein NGM10_15200 [Halorussus salilacus]|uniref:hypothetical protein n=1 Tax=Halorussus salilacus TaxID=2953750 RepID=UPI0020A222E0|nr:hypothetical protein [Halorussus salilacus]USZ68067.1 hypothetical protein NGM10_15200 [Halorussus salilacus]